MFDPFILSVRSRIWQKLAHDWKPPQLDRLASFIDLQELPEKIKTILWGSNVGRVVVKVS